MAAPQSRQYDVAIVGGGLVGASLACALAPLGWRVLLVEKVAFRADGQPSYDDRTLALSRSSCTILEGLGLWAGLAEHASPIREVVVTERGRPGRVVLRADEMGVPALGNVVEARTFGAVALQRLHGLEGLELRCPATVEQVKQSADAVELKVREGETTNLVEARLLVAADGAASSVREMLDIPARRHDYGQTAIICNITPDQEHRGRAFERLTPSGPCALLPHAGNRCGLVWSVPSEDANALMSMPDDEFMQRAQGQFGEALGRFRKIGRRSSYPLQLVRAESDRQHRALVLGNAAHAIHPVGAQGFNLGLRDVAVLAEVLAQWENEDPGSADRIAAYSQWRQPDHEATIAWTDGITRLFANPAAAARWARSAGMALHALLPPLRRRLASQAMGYRGRVPALALGMPLRRRS